MHIIKYLTLRNLLSLIFIIIGACAIAGLSFVYTITQANDHILIGSGKKTEMSFLPSDLITPVGIVLLALMLSFLLSFLMYEGRFQTGFYGTLGMVFLSLTVLLLSYMYPGFAGMVEYSDLYIIWVIKEVFIVMLFIFPISFVGAAVGIFFADRLEV